MKNDYPKNPLRPEAIAELREKARQEMASDDWKVVSDADADLKAGKT